MITLEYPSNITGWEKIEITDSIIISEIQEAIGTQWYHIFPMGSQEGTDIFIIRTNYKNGETSKLYIDEDEVGESTNHESSIYKIFIK